MTKKHISKNLKAICPIVIANASILRLDEIIRKSELSVTTQIENFRSIDNRATQIMGATGLMLSILAGIIFSSKQNILAMPQNNCLLILSGLVVAIAGMIGLGSCLRIIQSDSVAPAGNDGLVLLKDISDLYSEHEEKIDYIQVLSENRFTNEKLIKRNGRLLGYASWSLLVTTLSILLAVFFVIISG